MTDVEKLTQEVKELAIRVYDLEKQNAEIKERHAEIERSAEFIKSILGE